MDIDFDPLTPEGQEDINNEDLEELTPDENENETAWWGRLRAKWGRSVPHNIAQRMAAHIRGEGGEVPEYLELHELEQQQDDAVERIKEKYPQADTSKFISRIDDFGQVKVKLLRAGGKEYPLFIRDALNPKLPKTITNALGSLTDRLEQIYETQQSLSVTKEANDQKMHDLTEEIERLRREKDQGWEEARQQGASAQEILKEKRSFMLTIDNLLDEKSTVEEESKSLNMTIEGALHERESLLQEIRTKTAQLERLMETTKTYEARIDEKQSVIDDLTKTDEEREAAQQELETLAEQVVDLNGQKDNLERELGLTTKEKIKRALIKYGIPTAIAVAVAASVAAIMNSLKSAGSGIKKLGHRLTELGKKMAAAIPGLLGSVLSFILKTGGELLKLVGNNVWILVVAVGMVFLKELQRKR